jgi:2-polyprenyl-3-methyl-5-hydroxy-6-metoxy-1,4-benzoquinol methylase
MAQEYPRSRFVGYDLSEEAIGWAQDEARRLNLANVTFAVRDLTNFPSTEAFDLITAFDAIHDQARPDLVLAGIAKALRKEGVFLMQDIAGSSHVEKNLDHPMGPALYAISTMHCMTVSLAQGGLGLGTMWGEEKARVMLAEAGFGSVIVKRLPHDIQNQHYICRR